MRRDVFIENDSGGFSVVAVDAVDAIIADARGDDLRWVRDHKAMLILLYGDDSMPVRMVVDEPLTADEEAQWLARYTWQIDSADGRMLVMGGFDPDVLSWWKKDHDGEGDGRGIGEVKAAPGKWRVDVYAHVGSMNGRAILTEEAEEKTGAAYRRSHGDRPFPLWLAKMLEYSGDDDPGYEDLWTDVESSMNRGALPIDVEGGDAIGFLVHFTRATEPAGDPPAGAWIDRSEHSRVPAVFPLGLRSEVPDLELRRFHDRLLHIELPEPPRPLAEDFVEIIATWPGETLKSIEGGPVTAGVDELYLLHWMAGLMTDTTPRFELWIEPKGAWTPPGPTPDFGVRSSASLTAIGPVTNTGGWHTWWTSRAVARALGAIPDGSTITLASLPDQAERTDPDSTAGIALYEGSVGGGRLQVKEASPKVTAETLEDALAFVRELVSNNRIELRSEEEREAFEKAVEMWIFGESTVTWDGNVATLGEPDERTQLLLAPSVFRIRFGTTWPFDQDDDQ
jgi:hypothetical protein